jgi:GR25 family glycosyltransferase involved in LPS biosynthesis
MAKDQNMPAILVGEDDIMLYSKSAEMWEKAISELPDNWDILSGGMYQTQNRLKVSKMLCKVGDFSSTHYICVRNTCYDKILGYFKNNMQRKHIDRFMGKLSEQKKINVYLAWPMIARQREGYSDLRKKNTNDNITCKRRGLVFIFD